MITSPARGPAGERQRAHKRLLTKRVGYPRADGALPVLDRIAGPGSVLGDEAQPGRGECFAELADRLSRCRAVG